MRSATGRILSAPRMDAHNSFDNPDTLTPQPFSGTVEGGRVVVQMPAMGVAVLAIG
jgi:alpha-N-arabinofuranosidase